MSSVQLIFIFLRSILRSRAELVAENLVFTNATQAAEQGSKVAEHAHRFLMPENRWPGLKPGQNCDRVSAFRAHGMAGLFEDRCALYVHVVMLLQGDTP